MPLYSVKNVNSTFKTDIQCVTNLTQSNAYLAEVYLIAGDDVLWLTKIFCKVKLYNDNDSDFQ